MMHTFKTGKVLHYKYVIQLLFASRDLNASLSTLVTTTVNVDERLTVCGDTHGQLADLFSIFTINGTPSPTNRYIFNGDFVDRGDCGVEVVLTLMAWQLVFPNACMLNRGNHEERSQNETAGFMSEVFSKYNGIADGDPSRPQLVYDTFECTFDMLPLTTLIEKGPRKVIVLHGGLSDRPGIRLEHIGAINVRLALFQLPLYLAHMLFFRSGSEKSPGVARHLRTSCLRTCCGQTLRIAWEQSIPRGAQGCSSAQMSPKSSAPPTASLW